MRVNIKKNILNMFFKLGIYYDLNNYLLVIHYSINYSHEILMIKKVGQYMGLYITLIISFFIDIIATIAFNHKVIYLTRLIYYSLILKSNNFINKLPFLLLSAFFILAENFLTYRSYDYKVSIITISSLIILYFAGSKLKNTVNVNIFLSTIFSFVSFLLNYYLVDYLIFGQISLSPRVIFLNFVFTIALNIKSKLFS